MADEYIRLSGKPAAVVKEDAPEKEEFIKLTKPKPFESTITKTSQTVAPYVGRAAVEGLPFAGSFLGPEGTLAGTFAKTLLKSYKPDLFGEAPATVTDLATDTGKELLFNNALPKLITGLGKISLMRDFSELGPKAATVLKLKDFPAVREGAVREMTNQISGQYPRTQSQVLTEAATGAATKPTPEVAAERELVGGSPIFGGFGNSQPTAFRAALKDLLAGTGNFGDLEKEILKDVQTVRNFKLATGRADLTEELAVNKLLGSSKSEGLIDARSMADQLSKSEVLQEAISPETLGNLNKFTELLKAQQKSPKFDHLLNYASGRLTFALTGALLGGPLGTTAAAGGTLALTNKMLSKLMSNPETSALVVKALQTPKSAPEAGVILKALSHGMQIGADWATVPEQ